MNDEVQCATCQAVAYPAISFRGQSFDPVATCPSCGAEHAKEVAGELTPSEPPTRAPVFKKGGYRLDRDVPEDTPLDVMGTIRARLSFLDLELAKSAGYAAERKQLARMLQAAEKTK